MPENCPLTNCKYYGTGGNCTNEQLKNIKNSIQAAKEGTTDCIDCFEPKC